MLVLLALIGAAAFLCYKGLNFFASNKGGGNSKDVDVTTVTINKDGSISEVMVDDFDESIYDEEQLISMVNEEISRYGKSAAFDGLEVADGKVKLSLSFETDEVCSGFNDTVFFSDTMENLKSRGVQLPGEALMAGGDKAVVVSESMDVKVPKKIKYASPGAVISDKDSKKVSVTIAEGENAVIVY